MAVDIQKSVHKQTWMWELPILKQTIAYFHKHAQTTVVSYASLDCWNIPVVQKQNVENMFHLDGGGRETKGNDRKQGNLQEKI